MEFNRVLIDSSVWIALSKSPESCRLINRKCIQQGIEVLICVTVLIELTGSHIAPEKVLKNQQVLSTIRHRVVEDAFSVLDETPLELGRLSSENAAKTYSEYLPNRSVRKRRDLVIARTAQRDEALLVWENTDDVRKIVRAGFEERNVFSLRDFISQLSK